MLKRSGAATIAHAFSMMFFSNFKKVEIRAIKGVFMLRVWFGDGKEAVYNISMYFNNRYEKKWLLEDFFEKSYKRS